MATPREALTERLRVALEVCRLEASPEVVPAADPAFGDYQSNVAMRLAKARREPPRTVAARILEALAVTDLCDPPEVAGAGFINFRVKPESLRQAVRAMAADPRLGMPAPGRGRRVVIDFSSPNVAKPMHVGHIRSTIIGDCLARIARFLGWEVVAINHLGDWGTQFGKIIYGWKHLLDGGRLAEDPIGELVRLYREVTRREQVDDAVRRGAREELVRLQSGDAENVELWRRAVELSWKEFQKLYEMLGVRFDETLGESSYNAALAPLCARLEASGIAEVSEGALCIFFRDDPALAGKPALIRKSDGGFLYATTDLAAIEYRVQRWNPAAIWYVVGAPQALHFQQVFAAAGKMGVTADLAHVSFGSILGEDRKIMRTRAGDTVGLAEVLAEAVERARAIIAEKNPGLAAEEREEIARGVGLGAVKYAELSQHRLTDYVFSWQKLLAFQGNTAPYLQNAHVRIRSIFRKLSESFDPAAEILIEAPEERSLAVKLLQFSDSVPLVLEDFRPNLLANYLYELALTFHGFYEACPVLKAEAPQKASRLALCDLTARVLSQGLELLGIECPERM